MPVAGLAAAQRVRPALDNPAVTAPLSAPAALLRRACYACHSRETPWPWYAHVAPAPWLVPHDVHEGREQLDFSVWGTYPPAARAKKLRESAKEIREGEMPPWQYRLGPPRRTTVRRRAEARAGMDRP